jgi:transcription elongation factor GreA
MNKIYLTRDGYEGLQAELKRLKSVERPRLAKAIAEARAHGDLSENAEYKSAKEEQAFIETRVTEIETKLAYATVVDPAQLSGDKVLFGATLRLLDMETDEEIRYQIVGPDEADVKTGKISVESPVAKAMIGRKKGELVEVRVPKGVREFEILEVSFV